MHEIIKDSNKIIINAFKVMARIINKDSNADVSQLRKEFQKLRLEYSNLQKDEQKQLNRLEQAKTLNKSFVGYVMLENKIISILFDNRIQFEIKLRNLRKQINQLKKKTSVGAEVSIVQL